MIMQALLRILFYMSPILWIPKDTGISSVINDIMKFNPVYFLAESYRKFYSINGTLLNIGDYFFIILLLF